MQENKKFEILIATMNNNKDELIKKNNIKYNYVIANQSNYCSEIKDEQGIFITTNTKGVGINRNISLIRSSAKYILFSDDDIYFYDEIDKKIVESFEKNKKADILIFNIDYNTKKNSSRINKKVKRVRWYNFMNYGTIRIAAKRESIINNNIWFSLLFGGGAPFSCGEDSIFLLECLRKKLKIYTAPVTICNVASSDSSWFVGYDEKFFFDKGVFLQKAFKKMNHLFVIYFAFKYRKNKICKFNFAYKNMKKGVKYAKENL